MLNPRARRQSPALLTPSPYHPPIRPSSAFETVLGLHTPTHRPNSVNIPSGGSSPKSAMGANPPTLDEILLDVSSPPWTLTAFMAYLSQNHCMETLEFTLDSQRYASIYNQLVGHNPTSPEANDRVCASWEKLMQVYIVPCSPREVNIPARVRDRLLSLRPRPTPPHPSELEEAGRIIYELMNDSLLVPFIESVTPLQLDIPGDDHLRPHSMIGNKSTVPRLRSATSSQGLEFDGLTDDSDENSPPLMEPMTPPTTPPTSEWSFTASPGGFHRAVAAHNKGWKKVGEKLGFGRKASSRRPTPTSSTTTESDISSDVSHSHGHSHSHSL
ncbi:hypothetical protein HJFPF1_07894 [Paramyrothecium foliicola]|nr:hypothetical protein HJFPF1_07894 [Paramyrothecium foliicola]